MNSIEENIMISQRVNSIKNLTTNYAFSNISINKKDLNENINYTDDDLIAIINNSVKI